MSHGGHKPPDTVTPELAGVDENSQSSAQEGTPVPYVAGSYVVAAKWISPIYNQRAQEAPQEKRGKK